MLPRLRSTNSLASLDNPGASRILPLERVGALPCVDPSQMRDILLNRGVLDAKDQMDEYGIALDTPLFGDSYTLLTFAIAFEPDAVDKLLQDTRVGVNAPDGYGDLPLVLAVRKPLLLPILMAHRDINLNALDKHDKTALIEAVRTGERQAAELLLNDRRLDLNAHKQGLFVLHPVVLQGWYKLMELLVNGLTGDSHQIRSRMPARDAWKELGAGPGFYFNEQGEPTAISNARHLTVLYMQRLKEALAISDDEERSGRERELRHAYGALLRQFTKKPA